MSASLPTIMKPVDNLTHAISSLHCGIKSTSRSIYSEDFRPPSPTPSPNRSSQVSCSFYRTTRTSSGIHASHLPLLPTHQYSSLKSSLSEHSSPTEWNLVLALVRSTVSHIEAARSSFELVERLIVEGPDQCVSLDNAAGLIAVLDDFATAASFVAEAEMQQRYARRQAKVDVSR